MLASPQSDFLVVQVTELHLRRWRQQPGSSEERSTGPAHAVSAGSPQYQVTPGDTNEASKRKCRITNMRRTPEATFSSNFREPETEKLT